MPSFEKPGVFQNSIKAGLTVKCFKKLQGKYGFFVKIKFSGERNKLISGFSRAINVREREISK